MRLVWGMSGVTAAERTLGGSGDQATVAMQNEDVPGAALNVDGKDRVRCGGRHRETLLNRVGRIGRLGETGDGAIVAHCECGGLVLGRGN